jgi:hypothetical protein
MVYDMIGKRVYIKIKDSSRYYSGLVIDETELYITIKDIAGHLVYITKSEASFIQEEK